MNTKPRRSAGSYTPLEGWLHSWGVKRRDPAADLVAFNEGRTIKTLCLTWTLGQPRVRQIRGTDIVLAKGGWLYLTKGRDHVWRRTGASEEVTIPAGATLRPSARKLMLKNQTAFTVVTPDEEHDIAVRTVDADLLSQAFGQAP